METQKPQLVSSYVRYKQEKPQTDNWLPLLLIPATILIVAILFWQVTLTLLGTGLLTYKLHKVHAHREYMKQNGLPVNYLNGKRVYL